LRIYPLPGPVLTLHTLFYLILSTVLTKKVLHFVNEKTDLERLSNLSKVTYLVSYDLKSRSVSVLVTFSLL
jgi:hypothetical protein